MTHAGNFVHRPQFNQNYGLHFITNTNLELNQDQNLNPLATCLFMGKNKGKEVDIGCTTTTTTTTAIYKDHDDHDHDKGWLQLGISGGDPAGRSTDESVSPNASSLTQERFELNLFPVIRPNPNINVNQTTKNAPLRPAMVRRSHEFVRVISPPPSRPDTGVWFELRAAKKQGKEPFLPQIPKSYLRIKDGKMTVRLLMKYLAKRLNLVDESEVEITCRGQQLYPVLTVQFITNIWCRRRRPTLVVEDHLMILHYGRRAN